MSNNPRTPGRWKKAVELQFPKIEPSNILLSHLSRKNPASGLTFGDFLCLKVLWKELKAPEFQLKDYVDEVSIATAKELLTTGQCTEFYDHVVSESKQQKRYSEDSIFALVSLYMDLVTDLDASLAPEFPKAGRGRAFTDEVSQLVDEISKMSLLADDDTAEAPETPGPYSDAHTPLDMTPTPTTGPEGWSPAQPSELVPSEDEILVNMALVLLLNALTERKADVRSRGYRWLPNRDVYKILTSSPAGASARDHKLLEARTDGCLRHTAHNLSAALLEVKPFARQMHIYTLMYSKSPPYSEFGQLRCDKKGFKRRLLCSQDHSEIYITIAEYDGKYEAHLNSGGGPPPIPLKDKLRARGRDGNFDPSAVDEYSGFLLMTCYGPWRVNSQNDLKSVCETFLALSIYLTRR
ncbi:hypothetical protein MFIFM68171_05967 [Madurella fahalii]|uniref:Uncharacterized protein n=1 Tax=Madurella fahalii TaxID=1157608 RepID=A0ABQ0GDB9_9PEZI